MSGTIDVPSRSPISSTSAEVRPTSLWVVAGLAMAPAVALGFARFAYALLLPTMRADLDWTYGVAGSMNTANAGGYLAGALLAASMAARWGERPIFVISLFVTALAIAVCGLTSDFQTLIALRFIAGAFGALAFVTGGSLAATAAAGGRASHAPTALGLYFSGGGIGVLVSALAVPMLVATYDWRAGWLVLAGLSFVASVIATLALAYTPKPATTDAMRGQGRGWSPCFMAFELIGYGLFGAGYIAYATFIIAYLRHSLAFNPLQISLFWAILGLAAIIAAFAWGPVLARLTGGRGASATIVMVTIGAVIPVVSGGILTAYLSALLFGGSFLAVVAAVTSFARRTAKPHAWTAAIGALTVAFGIGQSIGPVLSGVVSDGPEGVHVGLLLSVMILAFASVISLFQAEPCGGQCQRNVGLRRGKGGDSG